MAFSVISVAPGLSHDDYRRAVDNGPEFFDAETDYPTMLGQTSWMVLDCQDITHDYASSIRRQLRADEELGDDLEGLIGAAELAERQAEWRSKLAAIGEGLLRRELFVATTDSA